MRTDSTRRHSKWALAGLVALASAGCGPNRTRPIRSELADAGSVTPLSCVPNLDGRIERNEIAAALGIPVRYLVSPADEARQVSLVGDVVDERRRWDLGADYETDAVVAIQADALEGKWYADSFPGGEFVSPTDLQHSTDSIYRITDDGLYLMGFASPEMDPPEGRTLIVYQPSVRAFALPLELDATWSTTAEVRNGVARGLPYVATDTYESRVVATGSLILPDVTFEQALRVVTTYRNHPSVGFDTERRQTSFVFECFGEVARAVAPFGDTEDDFTTAAELRRFGF